MATAGDVQASLPSCDHRRSSLHAALGGGAVADVLLLRRKNAAITVAGAATAFWFVFDGAGYSFLSVMTNTLLLLVLLLFFWAKSATLLNRPLPPLPNLEVSDEGVEKAAERARLWINRVLGVAGEIAVERDRKIFLQAIMVLWLVSYVGSLFSFLTLLYIGVLFSLTIPALYDKYQDHVDEKLGMTQKVLLRQYTNVLSKTGHQGKEKKSQ